MAAQFLTPLGFILSDEGNFEALLPSGSICAEEQGVAVPQFNLSASPLALAGDLSIAGDVQPGPFSFNLFQSTIITPTLISGDLSLLPASFSFGLPEFDLKPVSPILTTIQIAPITGVVEAFGQVDYSEFIPPLAEFAQYLTPRGALLTKQEADIYQPLSPLGGFVDSAFAFEFFKPPGSNYLTPSGFLYAVGEEEIEQVLLPDGSIDDTDLSHEIYERRREQYITMFGGLLEKTDGEVWQELTPFGVIVDNNYEFDEPVVSFEFAATAAIALHWSPGIAGDISTDVAGPGFDFEGPLAIRPMVGSLSITGDLNTIAFPWDLEGPPINIRAMLGALGISGNLQSGVPTDIPHNFSQVGVFTMRGALALDPAVFDYAPGPAVPFDINHDPPPGTPGTINLNGAVAIAGQIQSLQSFELATQPVLITGLLGALGELDAPFTSAWPFVQLGEITAIGVLTLGETRFRFEDFTEGLPRGWIVDGPFLETVPNPNYSQEPVIGAHFFRRYTWKGFDPAGTMVAASGSEEDCFAQTLSVCQSRHENWRDLVR